MPSLLVHAWKRTVALEQRERDLIGQWEGAKLDWVVERDRADKMEQAHAWELLKARLEEAKLQLQEHYCNSVICTCPLSKRIADLECQLAALPEEGKV